MSSADHVWEKPPTRASSGSGKRQLRAVRYTWAGPFNTQLYDEQLQELSNQTKDNLCRLAGSMMQSEPCNEYGIKHYHPDPRPRTATPGQRLSSKGSWSNMSVLFSGGGNTKSIPADDTVSISSTTSGAHNFCYLCSTMEEHQRNHLKLRVSAPVNKDGSAMQKKQRVQYVAPPPRVKRQTEEDRLVIQEALYKVTVWTGDVPGASTDAHVYITLVGDRDFLPKTRLHRRQGTSNFCFVRGSKETFHLKGPKLGELRMVTIEHDGLEKKHGWYLDRMEVQCMQTHKVWVVVCKNWLSMHHGDFRIKRDLNVKEKEHTVREFEVTVETGKKRLAGTDANVYITLHGTAGNSHKHHLNAHTRSQSFQKGQTDKFKIRVPDIGDIRSMRIEHTGEGLASGWFLNKVTLQDIHNPHVIYHFLYNGWLAKDIGDGKLWRELRAKKHLPKEVMSAQLAARPPPVIKPVSKRNKGKPVQYDVIVKTGDVRYAGTDANVYIIFIGNKGKSAKLFMDDSSNNFERGMTESFKLKAQNVGTLKSVILGHDNSGPGAGWFCEYVKVRKHLTRQEISDLLTPQKKAWKSSKQHQRKRLADKIKRRQKENINGEEDDEDKVDDEDDEDDARRRAKLDERFADVFDRDGKLLKVPVYEEFLIPCSKWFAADEADGLLERELDVQKQTLFFHER